MPCIKPKPAWATTDVDKEGKEYKTITFKRRGSDLDADYMIPCGKCVACHAERRRDWGIRMFHESQYHEQNSFVTLTYDDDNCPEELCKLDLDRFLARLRKHHKVRYFLCGEYGEKTHRPHYHAIIFGQDFRGGRYTYRINDELWGNKQLQQTWSHGEVVIGDFTPATAMYTAGYVGKKLGKEQEGFTIMSRKPPIGWQWAVDNQDQLNRLGHVVIEGRVWPIPKAYFKWIDTSKFRPQEIDLETAKDIRNKTALDDGFLWEDERRSKEINMLARMSQKQEKL